MHSLFFPDLARAGERIVVTGDEAKHAARVKRLMPGEFVRVFDGVGTIARARVETAGRELVATIIERRLVPPVSPRVEVWSATPKGPRLGELIEGLAQAGTASWTAISTKLGVVDPREAKLDRAERIALEASKQCARAHLMTIGEKRGFADALREPGAGEVVPRLILAEQSGEAYTPSGAASIRLIVGPEGGFTDAEKQAAARAGATFCSFGPHVYRIELAAVVGAAVILHEERRAPGGAANADA